LKVIVAYESTLTRSTASDCAAHCLLVIVTDEAALPTATACCGTAVGLHVRVLYVPALSTTSARPALSLKVGVFDKATLPALCEDRAYEQ
jgi:hypothetical protein